MSPDVARSRSDAPAGLSLRHEFVSTEGLRPDERFAFWRDTCLTRCEPFGPPDAEGEPFRASYRYLVAPEGEFTDLHMTASALARTQRLCRADGNDSIVISIAPKGGGAGWFGDPDRITILGSGLLRIRDQSRPYVTGWSAADNHVLHAELPRASFDSRTLGRILAAADGQIPSRGLAPMLAAQMRSFAGIAAGLDPAAQVAGLGSVLALAATVLRLEYGAAAAESEDCEDGMLVAAQALIGRRLAETHLSPDAIARRLGCSRAHLYRVFARHGQSVAGYLREIRLQRAHAGLTVAGPRDTVGNIAFRSGFDNPVYFAHAFYRRFGMRPSEVLRREGKPGSG